MAIRIVRPLDLGVWTRKKEAKQQCTIPSQSQDFSFSMPPKAPPERPRDRTESHAHPALPTHPEKPPTAPFEAEPSHPIDLVAWFRAHSEVRAILGATGISLDSQDDAKEFHAPWGRLITLLSAYQPSRHLSHTSLAVLRAGAVKRLIGILRACSVIELSLLHMDFPLRAFRNHPVCTNKGRYCATADCPHSEPHLGSHRSHPVSTEP